MKVYKYLFGGNGLEFKKIKDTTKKRMILKPDFPERLIQKAIITKILNKVY